MVFSKRIIAVDVKSGKNWRRFFFAHIFYRIASSRRKGFLCKACFALAFGERALLDNKTWLIYQQTNTAHLIAISRTPYRFSNGDRFFLCSIIVNYHCLHALFPWIPLCLVCVDCLLGYAYLAGFSLLTFSCNDGIAFYYTFNVRRYYTPLKCFV